MTLLGSPGACAVVNPGAKALYTVSLVTGAARLVTTAADIIVSPQVSPVSGDVVIQVGGSFGHLQTIRAPSDGNPHLLRAVIP